MIQARFIAHNGWFAGKLRGGSRRLDYLTSYRSGKLQRDTGKLPVPSNSRRGATSVSAFNRTDLLVVIGIAAVLFGGAALYLRFSAMKGRIAGCSRNLSILGKAMMEYSRDHIDELPFARIAYSDQREQLTWDTELKSYLSGGALSNKTVKSLATRERERAFARILLCPSDTLSGTLKTRRSYSMPQHDNRPINHPPGPNSSTGVGVSWSFGELGQARSILRFNSEGTNRMAIKRSMISEPKDTLLLTEQIQTNNLLGKGPCATIRCTDDHLATNLISMNAFHRGQFNYLMVDGHVETLQPRQTVGPVGQVGDNALKHHGMWTIKAGD